MEFFSIYGKPSEYMDDSEDPRYTKDGDNLVWVDIHSREQLKEELAKYIASHQNKSERIKSLKLKNSSIVVLRPKVFFGFPNLTSLTIFNCGIKGITAETFQGLDHLKELDLEDNNKTNGNLVPIEDVTKIMANRPNLTISNKRDYIV